MNRVPNSKNTSVLKHAPLADEADGLEALIHASIENDPGFADVWSPYAYMIALSDERVRLGLSQREVAQRMGVSQPVVARMESSPSGVAFARILSYAKAIGAEIVVKPSRANPKPNVNRPGRPAGRAGPGA